MRVFQNWLESEAKTIFHMLRKQAGQKGDLVLVSVLKFSIHHPHYSLSSTVQVESTKKSETIVILLFFYLSCFCQSQWSVDLTLPSERLSTMSM